MSRYLRSVAIDSLVLPGNWRQRLEAPHVKALADSGDILQPPAIRGETRDVIWGGDRLAAMWVRGEREASVWVYSDVSDDELAAMRDTENAYRRDPDLAARTRLVLRLAEKLRGMEYAANGGFGDEVPTTHEPRPPGRPKKPETIAREEVAAATGVTPAAIRKAEQRAKAGAQGNAVAPAAPGAEAGHPAPPPSSATPGIEVAIALDELDRLLMGAVTAITKLAKAHPELTERFDVSGLKWKLQREVAPGFRAMYPGGRCLYCKLVASELPNCGGCKGSGWLTREQLKGDIPPQLRIEGPGEGIFVEGKFVPLAILLGGPKRSAPRPPGTRRVPEKATPGEVWADVANGKPTVPLDHTRTVLEDDFSDAWTEGEK